MVHIANKGLVRDIPKLSGQPKSICGECMKDKYFLIGKRRRTNTKPKNKKGTPNTHLRVKQIWVKKKDFLSLHDKGLIRSKNVPLNSLRNLNPRKSL